MTPLNFLYVALGSALGGAGRYAVSCIPVRSSLPFATLAVNLLGAVLIGFITGISGTRTDVPPQMVLFLKTGVCGGFTTFSTFSLEAYNLFSENLYGQGTLYVALSVAGCLGGIWCGLRLAQAVCRS